MKYGRYTLGVVVAAAALAAAAGTAVASGAGGDWTQGDHDASGNRANTTATQITAANAGTVDWLRGLVAPAQSPNGPACGEGFTTPVLVAKRAYTVRTGRLVAIDLTTGNPVWQRVLDTSGASMSTVDAVEGGRVYVRQLDCRSQSDPNGAVLAFDAATGAPLWSQPVGGLGGVAVLGNRVLGSGTSQGNGTTIKVLDAATGAVVWQRAGDFCPVSARIVASQVYYDECDTQTGTSGVVTDLVAARLSDGAIVWRKTGDVRVERGDRVGSGSTHLFTATTAINPATGATRYTAPGVTRIDAVGTNRVFGVCGTVVCSFDKTTGARVWTSTIAASTEADPARAAVAATLLYLPTGEVLNSVTGALVTKLWNGQAQAFSVGDGYVAEIPSGSPRLLDVYGLPGS